MALNQLFENNAVSLLTSPISASSTTITVMPGHGDMFPLPQTPGDFFSVTLEDQAATTREIIHVTSRIGDTFTVLRGQEGTSARAWGASAGNDTLVDHRVTADTLYQLGNRYVNGDFPQLVDYREAIDYLLALEPAAPDLSGINAAIADLQADVTELQVEISPVFDRITAVQAQVAPLEAAIDQLQQQLILNNDYANPAAPAVTNFQEAIDFLLGVIVTGNMIVDAPISTSITGSQTLITLQTPCVPNTTRVYVGGIRQKRGIDFIEFSPTELRLQYTLTPSQVASGQNIVVDYITA